MSKKEQKHREKMKKKRDAKAQKRSEYAALAGTSRRAKRRFKRKSVISGPFKHAHAMPDCGNPGCEQCNPKHYPGHGSIAA